MAGLPSPEYMEAHMDDDRRPVIYGVCSMLIVLTTVALSFRLAAKRITRTGLTADDYLALASQVYQYMSFSSCI